MSIPASDPKPDDVSSRGGNNADGNDERKLQITSPCQVTRQNENRLFRHWQTHVPQDDEEYDGEVTPVVYQFAEIGHGDSQAPGAPPNVWQERRTPAWGGRSTPRKGPVPPHSESRPTNP